MKFLHYLLRICLRRIWFNFVLFFLLLIEELLLLLSFLFVDVHWRLLGQRRGRLLVWTCKSSADAKGWCGQVLGLWLVLAFEFVVPELISFDVVNLILGNEARWHFSVFRSLWIYAAWCIRPTTGNRPAQTLIRRCHALGQLGVGSACLPILLMLAWSKLRQAKCIETPYAIRTHEVGCQWLFLFLIWGDL